ncbi:MAG TPA: hypothetical protein VIT68_02045 [Candidatus Gracilibacteria bacterium]
MEDNIQPTTQAPQAPPAAAPQAAVTAPAAEMIPTTKEEVVETVKEKAEEQGKAAKKGFGEKFKGFFSKGKQQFVRLLPAEQITVFVGGLLVVLSVFDHYLTRAVIAIIGLVMIMVAFAGVKLNDLGKKKAAKDKDAAAKAQDAESETPAPQQVATAS